jgi:hypothetical protein
MTPLVMFPLEKQELKTIDSGIAARPRTGSQHQERYTGVVR